MSRQPARRRRGGRLWSWHGCDRWDVCGGMWPKWPFTRAVATVADVANHPALHWASYFRRWYDVQKLLTTPCSI